MPADPPRSNLLARVRLTLWVAVAVAALAGAGLWLWRKAELPAPSAIGLAQIDGPFTLLGSDGKPFSSTALAGRPHAIFFGFTNCPDVCPTTLARLVDLRRKLGRGEDEFAILFISVDPERDTPAAVGRYTALFGSPVIGLTGSLTQIDDVKRQFAVYSRKAPQPGGGYSVDHSAAVLLFDGGGRFVATIAPDEGDQPALAKLKRIAS